MEANLSLSFFLSSFVQGDSPTQTQPHNFDPRVDISLRALSFILFPYFFYAILHCVWHILFTWRILGKTESDLNKKIPCDSLEWRNTHTHARVSYASASNAVAEGSCCFCWVWSRGIDWIKPKFAYKDETHSMCNEFDARTQAQSHPHSWPHHTRTPRVDFNTFQYHFICIMFL